MMTSTIQNTVLPPRTANNRLSSHAAWTTELLTGALATLSMHQSSSPSCENRSRQHCGGDGTKFDRATQATFAHYHRNRFQIGSRSDDIELSCNNTVANSEFKEHDTSCIGCWVKTCATVNEDSFSSQEEASTQQQEPSSPIAQTAQMIRDTLAITISIRSLNPAYS